VARGVGTTADVTCFSFYANKTITTGEGGMLVTDNTELFQRVLKLRDHGREPGDRFFFNREVAFKYKMSDLQAALGTAQLERGAELVAKKRALFAWYSDRLSDLAGVTLNPTHPRATNAFWMVTLVAPGHDKTALARQLAAQGVATRPFFNPLSSLVAYAGFADVGRAAERNAVVRTISPYALNLPSALSLTEQDVDEVCEILRRTLGA